MSVHPHHIWPINPALYWGRGESNFLLVLSRRNLGILQVRKAFCHDQCSGDANQMCKRKSSSSSWGGEKGKERKGRKGTACESSIRSFPPSATPSPPLKLPLTVIYKVRNKLQGDWAALPLSEGKVQVTGPAAQWALSQASAVLSPCSERGLFCSSSTGPPGPSAPALSGTTNSCQHSTFLPKENLGPLPGKTKPPRMAPLQTEVTVLTLAERACLNLLFRSCMLGDLGRGMREVLRFSGVLLGCCL